MKYVSFDIETTCLAPMETKNVIGLSLVIEDTENQLPLDQLPHFTCLIDQGRFEGDAYALWLNGWIFKDIAESRKGKFPKYEVYSKDEWLDIAKEFLRRHFGNARITVAGKNVAGFDMQFMPEDFKSLFRHRVIDAGSVFINWKAAKDYDAVPSLDSLKAKYNMGAVSHDMYEDALDVIAILRESYPKKVNPAPLTEEERAPLD